MRLLAITSIAVYLLASADPAVAGDVYGSADAPIAGSVLGTQIRTGDAEELRYLVLKKLTDRYAEEKRITVTQAETDAYIDNLQRSMDEHRKQQEDRRDEIKRRLASGDLSEAEREALASELDGLNELLASLADTARSTEENPEEARATHEEVASAFIRQWKINQALYEQYGGRIIFQQGGPEPLDAYREFLEENQARGDFAILNDDMERAFWRYYLTDSIHSFYAAGSEEEARAFQTPWWLSK